jgi:uncharacterized protein
MSSELSIIMVPTTKCNLDCLHCFEERSDRVMSHAELRTVFRKISEYANRQAIGAVTFYWQGGEVLLLGPAWFQKMFALASEIFKGTGMTVQHRLQTNLISYSSRWKPVIATVFNHSVGSSLDYPSVYRGFRSLAGERFNDIWLKYCNKARQQGVDVSVISVINEASLNVPAHDFLSFYHDRMGLRNMQINLPFGFGRKGTDKSFYLNPQKAGAFMVDLFDEWIEGAGRWHEKIRVNPFVELIDVFSLAPRASRCNCIWSGNCGDSFFSIGPDGSVGLCDCWVTSLPQFFFGNLLTQSLDEIAQSPARQRLRHRIDAILTDECADCDYLGTCYGGCIIRTYQYFGTIERKDPYCEAYKMIFSRIGEYTRTLNACGGRHEEDRFKEGRIRV